MPKLLLINPNTSPEITGIVVRVARTMAAPGTEIVGATGRFGARYIMTRATSAIAAHAALDAYAAFGSQVDAVVLACFGDPGLLALKEIASQPVIGLAEASCLEAASRGRRFAIVTGGASWKPMLHEFVAALGLADRLAAIETVDKSGAEIAAAPDAAMRTLAEAIRRCVDDHGADCVILGGAGLAGLTADLAPHVTVPLIDCVSAGVALAEKRLRDSGGARDRAKAERFVAGSIGLSPELARLI